MIDLGANSIALSLLAAVAALFAAVMAGRRGDERWLNVGRWSLAAFAVLLGLASLALLNALYYSDFRVAYVASYTERALPAGYRLAAFWAGQEGSLLLWAGILAVMNLVAVRHWQREGLTERATLMGVLALVSAGFAALLMFAADPFRLLPSAPADGYGLNPLLQDWAMLLHPPTLFLGYAGYTIPLAMLIAVLVAGRSDNRWLSIARPWLLFSWLLLGIGILIGALWAYVELGWGGYWAWDPVENVSLLPWLTGTALLHSIIIQQRRGMFKKWNAWLIFATFLLCIFGTFLTRSGIVESVHTFGSSKISELVIALFSIGSIDPRELIAPLIMAFLAAATVAGAAVLVWRRRLLASEHKLEDMVSREGAFLALNFLMVLATAIVLVATIFPVISSSVAQESVRLGEPFYNRVVVPVLLVAIALMAVAPLVGPARRMKEKLATALPRPLIGAALATGLALLAGLSNPWALLCVFIGVLAVLLLATDLIQAARLQQRQNPEPLGRAMLGVMDANHRRYGGHLVHLGVILMMAGVAGSSLFNEKYELQLAPGQQKQAGEYTVSIERLREVRQGHYTAVETTVSVRDGRDRTVQLVPQTRFYDKAEKPYGEIALHSTPVKDIYITLAGWEEGGRRVALQILINPLTMWIWIGSVVLCLGATLGLLPPLLRRAKAHPAVQRSESSSPTTMQVHTP